MFPSLYCLQFTWEEDVEWASDGVFSYEDIEDVECDFAKKVADDLVDEGSAIVGGW